MIYPRDCGSGDFFVFCCCLAVVFCVQNVDKTAQLIDDTSQLVDVYKSKKMA